MTQTIRRIAGAALALAALAGTGLAQARDNVYWNLGIAAAPGVTLGVGNARPYVVAPQPVYVAPHPVYVAPQPVYVAPRPVFVRPAPVYYAGPVYYDRPHGHGRGHGHGHGKHRHHRHHR